VVDVVEEARADLVCLQEANSFQQWRDPVPQLRRLLPGWYIARRGELATLSRYPILAQRTHHAPWTERVILETQVDVKGQQVTVLNVHISTAAAPYSMRRRPMELPEYLRHVARVRADQVSTLLRVARAAPRPVIIVGDFNTPPRGLLYRQITRRFQDAFETTGWGLGHTYPAHLPLMRIDYIFAGEGLIQSHSSVPKVGASDHRPVVAEITIE
jgi:vancomycin resistance protein VanJ